MFKRGGFMNNISQNRRGFLRTGAAVGGLASLPGISIASQSVSIDEVSHGNIHVIDIKITHPDSPESITRSVGAGQVPNTIHHNGSIFPIASPLNDLSDASALLRTPKPNSQAQTFEKEVEYTQSNLYEEADANGRGGIQLSPSNGYEPISGTISIYNDNAIVKLGSDQKFSVSPGDSFTEKLDSRSVSVPTYGEPETRQIERPGVDGTTTVREQVGLESVEITPEIHIQNLGSVRLFGQGGKTVFPDISDPIVMDYIGDRTVTAHSVEGTNLLVLDRDLSNGGEL